MTRVYCWLTLCKLWDVVGARYDPDLSPVPRWLTERAQVTWFVLHNNRLYRWLDTPKPSDQPETT